MRITCPICGERDSREFSCQGADVALRRPDPDAGVEAWDDYVHLRDNPAGETRELWHHGAGCSSWIVVTRNTITHAVLGAELASEVKR
ncbi:MAG: sarcosine oxidase subunit delta [Aestuariivita sp.]|uniref:sarcosine oxidase subunit delta n=1 Tax=Aestuariivita sp. TaxID=1872407 RepID=UPI003BAFA442